MLSAQIPIGSGSSPISARYADMHEFFRERWLSHEADQPVIVQTLGVS